MAGAAAEKRMVTLRSREGDEFEVEAAVVEEWQAIKHMIKDDVGGAANVIPLPNISSAILPRVIEYSRRHGEARAAAPPAGGDAAATAATSKVVDDELKYFDADFVNVDKDTLYDLIMAASHLKITGLVNLTCKAVADIIKGKPVEEIRRFFNIPAPSPEEDEEARRQSPWAFE
ncbi:hypothetical protein ACP70R_005978 [Stipagrostis hirtigluma subsp. patula]